MLVLIDSDSPCYANGFAVEEKCELTGEVQVIKNGQKILESKLEEFIETVIKETGATDYKLFLTGKGNFREEEFEGVQTQYKANREGMRKPLLLQEARQYLIDEFDAIVVEGMEADDVVCIEQTFCIANDIDSCIAHIDKDINQQVGHHYRWSIFGKDSELYYVTEEEGLRNLYVQALVGDKVDNIMYYYSDESGTWKKNYGLGIKGAEKYLAIHHTEKEMYDAVVNCYLEHPKFVKKDTEIQTTLDDLHMNMKMLYMLRWFDDEWEIPE